jgi:hypothetical protein
MALKNISQKTPALMEYGRKYPNDPQHYGEASYHYSLLVCSTQPIYGSVVQL